jgi:hypothetical protein
MIKDLWAVSMFPRSMSRVWDWERHMTLVRPKVSFQQSRTPHDKAVSSPYIILCAIAISGLRQEMMVCLISLLSGHPSRLSPRRCDWRPLWTYSVNVARQRMGPLWCRSADVSAEPSLDALRTYYQRDWNRHSKCHRASMVGRGCYAHFSRRIYRT